MLICLLPPAVFFFFISTSRTPWSTFALICSVSVYAGNAQLLSLAMSALASSYTLLWRCIDYRNHKTELTNCSLNWLALEPFVKDTATASFSTSTDRILSLMKTYLHFREDVSSFFHMCVIAQSCTSIVHVRRNVLDNLKTAWSRYSPFPLPQAMPSRGSPIRKLSLVVICVNVIPVNLNAFPVLLLALILSSIHC